MRNKFRKEKKREMKQLVLISEAKEDQTKNINYLHS